MKAEGSVRPGEVVSFEAMAERTLGKAGGGVTGTLYLFYSYASILAYAAASGDVVRLLTQGALSSPQGQVVTVLDIFGAIVLAGSKGIQRLNEKLNYVFFLLLATIIGVGMLQVSPAAVVSNTNWGAAPGAAGILLFNVVFHDIIPVRNCKGLGQKTALERRTTPTRSRRTCSPRQWLQLGGRRSLSSRLLR